MSKPDDMNLSITSTLKLASGAGIPRFGLGVYQARGQECGDAIVEAIKCGYRHVDSAQGYLNEALVGKAVVESGVPRSEIYITTKYMPTHQVHSSSDVLKHLRRSLPKIDQSEEEYTPKPGKKSEGKGYVDLMLIHAPWGGEEGRKNNWSALADAQKEGWIKDIGVSNFGVKHLKRLPLPKPALNQIELHPWCQQRPIVEYCQQHGIVIEAYSPIVRGDKKRFQDPVLVKICQKHTKEPAQVLIRWSLQKGYVVIPKSVTPLRIKSNADVYDFELDEDDMKALDGLDQGAAGAVTWNPVDKD